MTMGGGKVARLALRSDDGAVRSGLLALLLLSSLAPGPGCAHVTRRELALVREARRHLGESAPSDLPFLGAVLAASPTPGEALPGAADPALLLAVARLDGRLVDRPRPGALVFFGQTAHAFHAGVVERVEGARISFVHAARGRVRRGTCDLEAPSRRRDGRGRIVNTYLVPRRREDLPGTRYLCGQLVLGFARF